MDTLDDLLNLKRLRGDPAFIRQSLIYDKKVQRLVDKLLGDTVTDAEAIQLKWAVYHLQRNHPQVILDAEIKSMESRIEKAHAENTK